MKNLNIGTRLAAGFALLLALMMLMTVIGIRNLQTVADGTQAMMQQPLAKERMVADWYTLIHTSVRRTGAMAKSSDASLVAFFTEDVANSARDVNALQQKVEALLETALEKEKFEEMKVARKNYLAIRDNIGKLKAEGQSEQANALLDQQFVPAGKLYLGSLQTLLNMQRASIDATAAEINAVYKRNRNFMLGFGALVLLCGVACAWWLTRGIIVPLHHAVDIAVAVANKDLRSEITVDSADETGRLLQALKTMNDSLLHIVIDVRNGTGNIASGSSEIAAGNMDLSARTEHQASSLEQTASSMEELTSTVRQNADNARQANTLAQTASSVAQGGGAAVAEVVATMAAIHESARKIGDIISVIDGIAFQTNILALNAAVEAARAGEQGRGFAVVASEVRNLAQRSAAAAREIKELINDSTSKVDAGSAQVTKAGATMREVVDSIQRVTDIMGEITTASAEQSVGIEQVNEAITQMDEVTQQNASLVEQAAAAAASLQEQAAALAEVVSVFKINEGGAQARLPR
ncbi:hypothetical protein CSQ96_04845 [Janthinobacterium sp. BJB412]|nr:hypothetical protein CSQ96_04845 [Janthinobacterium sp. BJB412]